MTQDEYYVIYIEWLIMDRLVPALKGLGIADGIVAILLAVIITVMLVSYAMRRNRAPRLRGGRGEKSPKHNRRRRRSDPRPVGPKPAKPMHPEPAVRHRKRRKRKRRMPESTHHGSDTVVDRHVKRAGITAELRSHSHGRGAHHGKRVDKIWSVKWKDWSVSLSVKRAPALSRAHHARRRQRRRKRPLDDEPQASPTTHTSGAPSAPGGTGAPGEAPESPAGSASTAYGPSADD